jgi:5-methylcytosine-specific restriction endonuclease McrA
MPTHRANPRPPSPDEERRRKHREYMRGYRARNRERLLERERQRYHADLEASRERARRKYADNPEAARARKYRWDDRNRERVRAENRAWYKANRERVNARVRANYDPLCNAANHAKYRALKNGAPGSATAQQVAARWTYYGDRCWMCGDPAGATDHAIPLSRGGSNWPANLRPACVPCNSSKSNKHPSLVAAKKADESGPA